MINSSNYFQTIKNVDVSSLPQNLKEAHELVVSSTNNGKTWRYYQEDEVIKDVIDEYFKLLEKHLEKDSPNKNEKKKESPQKQERSRIIPAKKTSPPEKKKEVSTKPHKEKKEDFHFVERIPEELRFIKRYVALHGKEKSKEDLLPFINSLQKAIVEKRIRKTSPYAKDIEYIQEQLVNSYNTLKVKSLIQIREKVLKKFSGLISEEKVMPSVQLIKRYIKLNGQSHVNAKAQHLLNQLKCYSEKGIISKTDKNWEILQRMFNNLQDYIIGEAKVLHIENSELNGLNGILSGCLCNSGIGELSGLEESEKVETPSVVNSVDFSNMQFSTLGFKGKFRDLIGDPSEGFSAMVFGKPKMGKSFLCVDFAGYLARNHGKVLYVAKEEGLDMTLQEKLKAKDVTHPNLFISEEIPPELGEYNFVFFDSVNKLGLSVKDLERLRKENPKTAFIYVFQTTKQGNFRGANEFQHDVDVVIEIPEKGKAVQFGRFNQGGEMNIFS